MNNFWTVMNNFWHDFAWIHFLNANNPKIANAIVGPHRYAGYYLNPCCYVTYKNYEDMGNVVYGYYMESSVYIEMRKQITPYSLKLVRYKSEQHTALVQLVKKGKWNQ